MSNDRFTLWREMFVPYLPQGNYQSPNQEIRIAFTDEGFAPFSYPYPDIGFRLNGWKPKFV